MGESDGHEDGWRGEMGDAGIVEIRLVGLEGWQGGIEY